MGIWADRTINQLAGRVDLTPAEQRRLDRAVTDKSRDDEADQLDRDWRAGTGPFADETD